jgi:hypothetical protein
MTSKKLMLAVSSLVILLAACGSPTIKNVQLGDVQVREVPASGANANTPDGKLSLFIFMPVIDRPLDTRISITEQYLSEKGCRLGTTNQDMLARLAQGAGRSTQILMAPVKC